MFNFKKLRESREGFTLVELLVVVVILAILAAIAVPIFMNQKKKAEETATQATLAAIAAAIATADSTGGQMVFTPGFLEVTDGTGATITVPTGDSGTGGGPGGSDPNPTPPIPPNTPVVPSTDYPDWCVSLESFPGSGVYFVIHKGMTKPIIAPACYSSGGVPAGQRGSGGNAGAGGGGGGGGGDTGIPAAPVLTYTGDTDNGGGTLSANLEWTVPAANGATDIRYIVWRLKPDGVSWYAESDYTSSYLDHKTLSVTFAAPLRNQGEGENTYSVTAGTCLPGETQDPNTGDPVTDPCQRLTNESPHSNSITTGSSGSIDAPVLSLIADDCSMGDCFATFTWDEPASAGCSSIDYSLDYGSNDALTQGTRSYNNGPTGNLFRSIDEGRYYGLTAHCYDVDGYEVAASSVSNIIHLDYNTEGVYVDGIRTA